MVVQYIAAALTLQSTLIILGLTLLSILLLRKPKNWKVLSKIPGPRKLPIFGNGLDLNVESYKILGLFDTWTKLYGKRYYFTVGRESRVVMTNRNDIEKVLTSTVNVRKANNYRFLEPWLGTGLITNHGEKWVGRRKLITPAFHFRVLENFIPIFNEQINILVEILNQFCHDNQTFDILPYITRCTLDMISETAMGTRINAQVQENGKDFEYVKAIIRISDLAFRRMMLPWLGPNVLWRLSPEGREEQHCLQIIHKFAEKVIRDRKAEMIQNKRSKQNENTEETLQSDENIYYTSDKKRLAFLDLLLEAQMHEREKEPMPFPLTDRDIREEVDTFMFAGHDTTTANISWTLFLLGTYTEAQVKVQMELDSIFGEDKKRSITSEDLTKMKYLEACIKESLRIYPSIPKISRSLHSDLHLDDKVILPAGTTAYIIFYLLHRDPEVFPDPENFLPERFFPENAHGRHPFAYVPFSAGPRNCIGQKFAMTEVKITVAQILRNFNMKAMEKREDVKVCADIVLRPHNGILVQLSQRNKIGN